MVVMLRAILALACCLAVLFLVAYKVASRNHQQPAFTPVQNFVQPTIAKGRPMVHVAPPPIRPDSQITIVLKRGACYGSCPVYDVSITTRTITFDGHHCVAALGKHTAPVEKQKVRELAKKFVADDFYSMDARYVASITDSPAYRLSIAIDGKTKEVTDYVGLSAGMPRVIEELENDVDALAQTKRWIGQSESAKRACMGDP